jgi:hypothetical protein
MAGGGCGGAGGAHDHVLDIGFVYGRMSHGMMMMAAAGGGPAAGGLLPAK